MLVLLSGATASKVFHFQNQEHVRAVGKLAMWRVHLMQCAHRGDAGGEEQRSKGICDPFRVLTLSGYLT